MLSRPTPQKTDENCFWNNHLRFLEMVLRAYSKWRNISSRKSIKTRRQQQVLRDLNLYPLHPSSLPFSKMETPLRTGAVKDTGLLVQGLSLGEGLDISVSHSAPCYMLLRLCSGQLWLRDGDSLLPPNSCSWDRGSTLGASSLSMLGPDHPSMGYSSWVMYTWRGKLRRPEAASPSVIQLLK